MKATLAGYNIDAEIISELTGRAEWHADNITPETLSSAYARISRDPRDVGEIRAAARRETDRARRSNRNIIFGLGHSSVAEHAVFNFDITGLSRYAVEAVQDFRFASFTEKSQRYIRLTDDFLVPEEVEKAGLADSFADVIAFQNSAYHKIVTSVTDNLLQNHDGTPDKRTRAYIDGRAKEDARYVVSLATHSQFGMTVNARTLEQMICHFAAHKLAEVQSLGKQLYSTVKDHAPSVIKYVEPSEYLTGMKKTLRECAADLCSGRDTAFNHDTTDVRLVKASEDVDVLVCATLLFEGTGESMGTCLEVAGRMSDEQRRSLVRQVNEPRKFWEKMTRHYELPVFTFELILSATNYAQMKRHRISTQILQSYNPALGTTVPPSIVDAGEEQRFTEVMKRSESLYRELFESSPVVAPYILTNAHRRRMLLTMNLRELYHFSSLREDEHAQWDIRKTAGRIRDIVTKVAPVSALMLCGKSDFSEMRRDVF